MSNENATKGLCLEFQLGVGDVKKITEKCPSLKDPPHVTLLYVGKHSSIGDTQLKSFQHMISPFSNIIRWKIVSVEVGKWLPAVVFLKLEFESETDENKFKNCYKLAWDTCDRMCITPQMTNATRISHPGCHITLAKATSLKEAELLADNFRNSLSSLIGKTFTFYPVIMFGTELILFY